MGRLAVGGPSTGLARGFVDLKRVSVSLAIAGTLALCCPADASPACGLPEDAKKVKRAFQKRMACEIRRAAGVPISCADAQAACAAEIDGVAAMLEGASADGKCQRELYRQSKQHHGRRSAELRRDRRRARRASRFIERIERACGREATLSLGGVCSGVVDPIRGAFCLRAALEGFTQRATGRVLRPNIVLIVTDDQRADTLWAMPLLQEHVVDRGVQFSNSFTSTSLCCPDRASIFTGQYAHNHGVTSNAGAQLFDHDGDTIQRQLRENAGYKTALVGKYMVATFAALGASVPPGWDEWHVFLSSGGFGSTHGLYYNYVLSTNGSSALYAPLDGLGVPTRRHEYSTDLLRDRALALIDAWVEERFFLEYAPFAPHTRAVAADRHVGVFAGLPLHRPPNHMPTDLSGKPFWVSTTRGLHLLGGAQPAETDARRIEMLETLPAVDEAVASISARLEEQGLTDNTLVAFTSDNGYHWLEHWLTLKNYPYEESIRVPLVMRYPLLVPAARLRTELVQSIDFYPTFAELAGIPGAPVNGRSLVPLLDGTATSWRQEILIEHFGQPPLLAPSTGIRTHDWKLIRTDAPVGVTLELYDMANDPFEMDNVAEEPENAGIVATLSAELDALEQQ